MAVGAWLPSGGRCGDILCAVLCGVVCSDATADLFGNEGYFVGDIFRSCKGSPVFGATDSRERGLEAAA